MKPEAGQWWCMKDEPSVMVWSVGLSACGNWVIEWSDGTTSMSCPDDFYHEPRCTGWDWVVPEPQPAEDPDEWVVLDPVKYSRHVLRKNIDFTNTRTGWEPINIWGGDTIVGILKHYSDTLFRCRRRDLPKVEQAEKWPKYWTKLDPADSKVAYVKQVSKSSGIIVYATGHESDEFPWCKDDNSRKELTKAEAMKLLKKPEQCIKSFDCANGDHSDACPVAALPQPQKKLLQTTDVFLNQVLTFNPETGEYSHKPQPQKTRVSDETLELIAHLRDQMDVLSKRVSDCEKQLMMAKAFGVQS